MLTPVRLARRFLTAQATALVASLRELNDVERLNKLLMRRCQPNLTFQKTTVIVQAGKA